MSAVERDEVDEIIDLEINASRSLPVDRAFVRLDVLAVTVIRRGKLTPARRERLLEEAEALARRALAMPSADELAAQWVLT